MQFRLLGPLEVREGDRSIRIGAPKHRVLVAALLVHANHVVSVDHLTSYLWDDHPPATAHSLVRVYVSQVRRALAGAGIEAAKRLVTQPPGYLLSVSADELDVHVFEELLQQAERVAADGRHSGAAALLGRALELWRGEPLADVASELLQQVEAPRLAERRMVALEARIEADLLSGRHQHLVPELEGLVAAHPLRERLRGHLMVALYRSGRRADALAAYQTGRRHLAETLGLDPDAALQQLEHAILVDHPALAMDGRSASPPPALPMPFQLPPDIDDFTGRDEERQHLLGLLGTGTRGTAVAISAIAGQGGVGKTALALRVAHELRQAFPDGQLFVDLAGHDARPLPPQEVIAEFLRALGVHGSVLPEPPDERLRLYRSKLADRRVLVVLDNAESEKQVRPLIPSGARCAAIVTSRRPLAGLEAVHHITVGVFAPSQALDLLSQTIGAERVAREPGAAAEICALCGHLPLAVRIAGARLRTKVHWTLSAFAERLRDERRALDELIVGDLEVRASLALGYEGLTEQQRRTVRLLGLIEAEDFAPWAVTALLGLDPNDESTDNRVEDLIEGLVDAQLLGVSGPDPSGQVRYRFHDLLRVFARERLRFEETPLARQEALERLFAATVALAVTADAGLRPHRFERPLPASEGAGWGTATAQGDAARKNPSAWLEAERGGLVEAVDGAWAAGLPRLAWQLAVALSGFFERRSYWGDWERSHTVALAAGRALGGSEEAWILQQLGQLEISRWRSEDAQTYLMLALQRFREADDRVGIAYTLQSLGENATDRRDPTSAHTHLSEALALFATMDDARGQAMAQHYRGMTWDVECRYEEAVGQFRACAAVFRSIGDHYFCALTSMNLAGSHRNQGRPELALPLLEDCLSVWHKQGDELQQAIAYRTLGLVLRDLGHLERAVALLEDALVYARRISYPRLEGACLHSLGEALRDQGNYDAARRSYDRALQILDVARDALGPAETHRGLGRLARLEGRYQAALAHFDHCLPLLHERGYRRGEALALHDQGLVFEALHRAEDARRAYASAARIFEEIGLPAEAAEARADLRRVEQDTLARAGRDR